MISCLIVLLAEQVIMDSIKHLFQTINTFTRYSGLKLNINKTTIYWLGPWRVKQNEYNLKTVTGGFNMLGTYIGTDLNLKIQKNFIDKKNSMTKRFNIWSGRAMSLIGKILLSKTYGMSNFIYSLTMSVPESTILSDVQQEMNSFIWGESQQKSSIIH